MRLTVHELTAVVESVRTAKNLAVLLQCNFSFPLWKTKVFPIDQPEILVSSLLVIGTKLCLPFPPKQKPLLSLAEDTNLTFDWQKWTALKEGTGQEHRSLYADAQFKHLSVEQVVSMENGELDSYLRYMSDLIHRESRLNPRVSWAEANMF